MRDGSRLGGGRYIRRSSSSERPGSGEYKVVLVIAPNRDYHWYVLNTNGYWSHKRGHSRVTNVDASGKRITNPQTCNRNYGNLNYSVFIQITDISWLRIKDLGIRSFNIAKLYTKKLLV